MRTQGVEPLDSEVKKRIGERQQEPQRKRQANERNAAHPGRAGLEMFRREVLLRDPWVAAA